MKYVYKQFYFLENVVMKTKDRNEIVRAQFIIDVLEDWIAYTTHCIQKWPVPH